MPMGWSSPQWPLLSLGNPLDCPFMNARHTFLTNLYFHPGPSSGPQVFLLRAQNRKANFLGPSLPLPCASCMLVSQPLLCWSLLKKKKHGCIHSASIYFAPTRRQRFCSGIYNDAGNKTDRKPRSRGECVTKWPWNILSPKKTRQLSKVKAKDLKRQPEGTPTGWGKASSKTNDNNGLKCITLVKIHEFILIFFKWSHFEDAGCSILTTEKNK